MLLALAGPALATPITVVFSGTIDIVDDPGGLTDGSIAVGVPFTGRATWDDAVTDTDPADPRSGKYKGSAPPWTLEIHVGNYDIAPGALGVEISVLDRAAPNPDPDVFSVAAQVASLSGPLSSPNVTTVPLLQLESAGNTLLGSDALTAVPLSLATWDFARIDVFLIGVEDPVFAGFGGPIETFVVPEPATAVALGLGLAALGRSGVRSSRRRA
jgi:hypothetical protein